MSNYFKNKLLKAILPIARSWTRKHPPTEQRRILVIATTALGDTLWATPALASLRASFPQAYLAVLTSPIGLEILKHNPWTNQLYFLKEPVLPRFFSLWKTLYRDRFDTVLIFHASQRLVPPLCSLLGASHIVGTAKMQKGLDSLLTAALPNTCQHEIMRRLKMVEAIGGQITSETLSFFLQPGELYPLPPGRWIAIHPGSKDRFKRWPPENFALVARRLQETLSCEILITGAKSERPLMEQVALQIPGAHLADSNLPLRSFASLLSQVDLLISNDTGPAHLAWALQRPAIALYSATDPRLYGPHKAKRAIALAKPPTCTPCLKRKCRSPFCLLQITPAEVAEAALGLLNA